MLRLAAGRGRASRNANFTPLPPKPRSLLRPRVAQPFAVSGGRAEVILGRGSSIDSFPLFGYDLADYEQLFEEKAQLFAELLKGGPVTWKGTMRAQLHEQDVVPHTESGPFPAWIGVGGNPRIGRVGGKSGSVLHGVGIASGSNPPAQVEQLATILT